MPSKDIEIIIQDVKAAKAAFNSENFKIINIYGNRIISNASILDIKNITIIGMVLKDVASFLSILVSQNKLDENKEYISKMINTIIDDLEKERDSDPWKTYIDIQRKMLDATTVENEKDVYEENEDFVNRVISYLIGKLDQDRRYLLKISNSMINGLINELTRVIRAHGATETSLIFLLTLRSFGHLYSYLILSSIDDEGKFDTKAFEKIGYPYVDRIRNTFTDIDKKSIDEIKKEAMAITDDLLFQWRVGYIHFMDIGPGTQKPVEKKIDLPEETKKKIEEALQEVIEKEIE